MKNEISVIIPFYNAQETLSRAVSSVLNQTNSSWKAILVNDGSSDCSEHVAKNFIDDRRIAYYRQENKGVSAARNLGAKKAKTNWLVFLDADDELSVDALSIYHKAIAEFPGRSVWLAGLKKIAGNINILRIPYKGKFNSKIPGTFCLNKALFDEVGGYDELMKYSENTELFFRIELLSKTIGFIPKATVNYYDSIDGGSKNLQNMVGSLQYFLSKHNDTLSVRNKHLYHQIIGVIQMRFRNFTEARTHLTKAIELQPNISTIARLGVSYLVPLAKILYKEKV